MNASGPLAGKTIAVTRPLAQAGALVAAIEAAGGRALLCPLLEISPAPDASALQQAAARLADYAFVIFISPNAVDYSLPAILAHGAWPAGVRATAIGPGTVKALAAYGIKDCLAPGSRFDSEGLLAEAALERNNMAGQRVLILRGNGGRELLADTLSERGARVDYVTCYQRSAPQAGLQSLIEAWQFGQLSALTLSSSEALRYLLEQLSADCRGRLAETPIFVPHVRIAENACAAGLHQIILTEGADAGILAGLLAYNWIA